MFMINLFNHSQGSNGDKGYKKITLRIQFLFKFSNLFNRKQYILVYSECTTSVFRSSYLQVIYVAVFHTANMGTDINKMKIIYTIDIFSTKDLKEKYCFLILPHCLIPSSRKQEQKCNFNSS